ncbi:MAG: hypothetical protein KTR19_12235, partial [Hyphomicrobiales bacterium]|nr:hypothetical protein [Hyphomicrobiales bacterium]
NLANYLRQNADALPKYDLIYTFGTTVTKTTHQATKDKVPLVFNIVSDPVRSKLVDSYENKGWNRAGLAVSSTILQQIDLVEALASLDAIGFVFNPREKNSQDAWDVANREITSRGGKAFFMRLNAQEDVAKQVARAFGNQEKISAIMLPSDSLIVSKSSELMAALLKLNVPVFAATPILISKGAVAGLTSNYTERGQSAAKLALAIFENGTALEVDSVPMKPTILINRKAAASFGISVPERLKNEVQYLD